MQMPTQGSILSPTFGQGAFSIPEKYESAFRAGIRFFEIIYPKHTDYPQTLMGLFNVKVDENNFNGIISHNETWLTQHDAGVQFLVPDPKKRVAVAHIPDDRFFHNRFMIADTKDLYSNIVQMIDPRQGTVPGAVVVQEIMAIRDIVYEEVDVFRIMSPAGKEVDFFYSRGEAEDFIAKETTKYEGPHLVPVPVRENRNCKIVMGKTVQKKKFIEEMILRNRGHRYGWTASDEFNKELLPQIRERMKERTKQFGVSSSAPASVNIDQVVEERVNDTLMKLLSNLSPEKVAEIRAAAIAQAAKKAAPQEDESLPPPPMPSAPQSEVYTETVLKAKSVDDLREIAISLRVPYENIRKADLIDAIIAAQMEASENPITIS